MTTQTIEPTADQLRAFAHENADDAPVVMLNLLRYRAQANYSAHPHEVPCSGREAFKRYSKLSIVCIEASGGKVLFIGNARASVIGPTDEQWDDIFLVQYPSRTAFLQMIATPEYRAINFHRSAALQDSRLIPVHSKLINL
ncbi:MAG TPA: DUF1330 domain-containing protein [Spongiibacteraceae bacterium]|nr:DUF1330 domain-containing protein [Spongiibacteraceae bacterium]